MFKKVPLAKFYRLINHGPCVLITSKSGKRTNIAPIAWNMPLNDEPPMVAIAMADSHYSTELIHNSRELVVNVADKSLMKVIKYSGSVSGRSVDKIKKLKLGLSDGITINTPHLDKAAAFLECKVIDWIDYEGVILFIGKVLNAEVRKEVFDEYWISDKAEIVHHLGGSVFACLGKRFKA